MSSAAGRLLLLLAVVPPSVAWLTPPPHATFFWQLQGNINLNNPSAVFDIDGFAASPQTIATLHSKGKKVICYFSFGSYEDFRPDASKFNKNVLGGVVCQDDACTSWWPGELWLDIRSSSVRSIMEARVKLGASKGCDGIEPDNLDAYANNIGVRAITKFKITQADQLNYLSWISTTVHKYNLSVGLKNAGELAPLVVAHYDWALSEECNANTDWSGGPWYAGQYQCDYLNLFVAQGKAAFVAEYSSTWTPSAGLGISFPAGVCTENNAHGYTTKEYDIDLTGVQYPTADCLNHQPSSCSSACWKPCLVPTKYKTFQTDPAMGVADAIGQCQRKCAATLCKYI